MSLKKQLIRLGSANPDLRKHISPVLASLQTSKSASLEKTASGESLYEYLMDYCNSLAQVTQKLLRKNPDYVAHRVKSGESFVDITDKVEDNSYTIGFNIRAKGANKSEIEVIYYYEGDLELQKKTHSSDDKPADIAEKAADLLPRVIKNFGK